MGPYIIANANVSQPMLAASCARNDLMRDVDWDMYGTFVISAGPLCAPKLRRCCASNKSLSKSTFTGHQSSVDAGYLLTIFQVLATCLMAIWTAQETHLRIHLEGILDPMTLHSGGAPNSKAVDPALVGVRFSTFWGTSTFPDL